MTPQTIPISESMQFSYIQTDKFKTSVLTLTLCLPLTKENTILNMILPGVLRRGTDRYPDMASINRRLDELYASCVEIRSNRMGKNLLLTISAEMLDESYASDGEPILEGVVDVIAQMLLHPKMIDHQFCEEIVRQEIRFARDSIRAESNNTRAYAAIRCMELMHRNDPSYPTLQKAEELLNLIDNQMLVDYYDKVLRNARIDAFYVGSLPMGAPLRCLQAYFSDWRTSKAHPIIMPVADPCTEKISVTEAMPVSQGKLSMGFRTGVCANGTDDTVYTAMVFNEIFGGSPMSKLFMNVREKMSLCYYCSSAYNRYTGILTVSAGIENKNREIAEAAIRKQLESIQSGDISQSEMLAAKSALENSYRQIDDNPFELQGFFGSRALLGLPGDIEDCRRHLAAVTKEQVVAFSQQVLCDTVFFVEGTRADAPSEEDDQ